MNPIKAKEQLVKQLQEQIVDLERFIDFLQAEANEHLPSSFASLPVVPAKKGSLMNLIKFNQKFERNQLKQTPQGCHYGQVFPKLCADSYRFHFLQSDELVYGCDNFSDERARIELAVEVTTKVMDKYLLLSVDTETSHAESYSESCDEVRLCVIIFLLRKVYISFKKKVAYVF